MKNLLIITISLFSLFAYAGFEDRDVQLVKDQLQAHFDLNGMNITVGELQLEQYTKEKIASAADTYGSQIFSLGYNSLSVTHYFMSAEAYLSESDEVIVLSCQRVVILEEDQTDIRFHRCDF